MLIRLAGSTLGFGTLAISPETPGVSVSWFFAVTTQCAASEGCSVVYVTNREHFSSYMDLLSPGTMLLSRPAALHRGTHRHLIAGHGEKEGRYKENGLKK